MIGKLILGSIALLIYLKYGDAMKKGKTSKAQNKQLSKWWMSIRKRLEKGWK